MQMCGLRRVMDHRRQEHGTEGSLFPPCASCCVGTKHKVRKRYVEDEICLSLHDDPCMINVDATQLEVVALLVGDGAT